MRIVSPDFIWAAGIENTAIAHPDTQTGRILDEYALTEHYDRWEEDLALLATLGVTHARYGIPWHRVNPRPRVFDWGWVEIVLEKLVTGHGIEPIVDLVHYGAPAWMEQSFLHPEYPERAAEYAAAFAERFHGLCSLYTPSNEPRIGAWWAGMLGRWPPYLRGTRGFLRVLMQICRGICLTQRAIRALNPKAQFVHVDASDLYTVEDSRNLVAVEAARRRQQIVFLALDLATGRVDSTYTLYDWLLSHGVRDSDLEWFIENRVEPDVIGINMYPMFSGKRVRVRNGRVEVVTRKSWTETLEALIGLYTSRYAPIPVMITETAATPRDKVRWIRDSTQAALDLRESGVPLIGYTYWPLYTMVAWRYQSGIRPMDDYMYQIGLWNLVQTERGLERIRTPAADAFESVIKTEQRGSATPALRGQPTSGLASREHEFHEALEERGRMQT